MMLKALELDNTGELTRWLDKTDFDIVEKVAAVKLIYKNLGVDKLAFKLMDQYYNKGLESLQAIKIADVKKTTLKEFATELMKRAY